MQRGGGHSAGVRLLLACGVAAPLLYVGTDLIGGLSYPGYRYATQAISEMSAIGAPTAGLLAPLYTAFSVLFVAFAAGVWFAAGTRRRLLWSAGFMIALAALGIGWALFPMNARGAERTFTDTMHLVLSAASVLLLTCAMACGAAAFGRTFRIYSALSITTMLIFGYLTTMDVPRVDAGLPTPHLGINERLSMAAWLLWTAALAISLLRSGGSFQVAQPRRHAAP